ncbi:MlaD family protein [Puniceibacterium sp. IMCC21224]|uniref:MlaD family protein n=1 Tax=Puniceibacterium sp. IMCC21224 TaxID=1618204 RepID=UPI00064E0CA8|nr:MCE family protein [Puniceibacterium sp. IMCC21224]KMK65633.1 ABC-type transport system, periplasmic component [Puniceibacterium sp. IMCC21224]
METRANYVLIGVFTLLGLGGILAFFLWFAQVELDRQFSYYDVSFESVAGLSNASDVRFSGLPVGQVVDVRLSPDRDGSVTVRVEVDAATPVRSDSVATIESQGVTGVSYVGISAGTPEAPMLEPETPDGVPHIQPGRSVIQSLSEDAPRLLQESLNVITGISELLNPENQSRVEHILINVEAASDDFAATLKGFSSVTSSVADFAQQIDRFNSTLEVLTGDMSEVLNTADNTLASIGELSEQAKGFLDDGSETLNAATGTLTTAEGYLASDLPALTDALRETVSEARTEIATLSASAQTTLGIFSQTGTTATARLQEAEVLIDNTVDMIANLDVAVNNMDQAAIDFDLLMETDATEMVAEARVMIDEATNAVRQITAITDTDLPVIVADIRAATDSANQVVQQVGADLTAATGRIDTLSLAAQTTLSTVTNTFSNANLTLSAVNSALATGQGALEAAERAFDGADRVMNEDVSAITGDLRASISQLNGVIAQVSEDIPGVTSDLRAASRSAEATFAEVQRIVASSGGAVTAFANDGLPLYARLAQETRTLISNLDRLTTQIQRDPTRFFLNKSTPEYRR